MPLEAPKEDITSQSIAKSTIKQKDNTNPELVKAVEDAIATEQTT